MEKYLKDNETLADLQRNGYHIIQNKNGLRIRVLKDGRIGIFDTKAEGYNEDDNKEKSQALQQYITDEIRSKGKKLVGGLVIYESGKFLYFDRNVYEKYSDNKRNWKEFDELF